MKILLPIDGSDCSKATIEWVAQFFKNHDKGQLSFYLLHVVELIPEVPISDYDLEEAMQALNVARKHLEGAGYQVAESEYIIERPARAICLYADEKQIDQIVMGSHGRKGLAKFFVGSVSTEVADMAKQPVMIYHNGPKPSLSVSHVDQVHLAET